jgi:hypothetical protein
VVEPVVKRFSWFILIDDLRKGVDQAKQACAAAACRLKRSQASMRKLGVVMRQGWRPVRFRLNPRLGAADHA